MGRLVAAIAMLVALCSEAASQSPPDTTGKAAVTTGASGDTGSGSVHLGPFRLSGGCPGQARGSRLHGGILMDCCPGRRDASSSA